MQDEQDYRNQLKAEEEKREGVYVEWADADEQECRNRYLQMRLAQSNQIIAVKIHNLVVFHEKNLDAYVLSSKNLSPFNQSILIAVLFTFWPIELYL